MRAPLQIMAVLGLALAASTLAGCSSQPGPGARYTGHGPELVLRVSTYGGFISLDYQLTELPIISVYGNGTVITAGPAPAIYPGPAVPAVTVRQISGDDVSRLVDLAVAAGVGGDDDGSPLAEDAGYTRFILRTDAGLRVSDVYALGASTGVAPPQLAARTKLSTLLHQLTDLSGTLGVNPPSQPYRPTALAALASAWAPPSVPAPPPVAWPAAALPGPDEEGGTKLPAHCLIVTGADATAVLAAASRANSVTPWTSAGSRWTVALRPLLPDETSCLSLVPPQ
jgi:hypothetical protein